MDLLDIHTHHFGQNPKQAIFSCNPQEFSPQKGHYYSVGYHPWYLTPDGNEDWSKLTKIATHPQVLAIGEAGLDKIREVDFQLQENAFEKQIFIALLARKPLIIHAVKSYNEVILLKKAIKPDNPWIVHGFRGKKELATQLTDHGIYLSFGEKYQEEALLSIPVDKLFLETDDSEIDIHQLYKSVASFLSLPVEKLIAQVQQNITNVFFK